MIWKLKPTLEILASNFPQKSMGDHVGLEIVDIGDDYITGRIPVDHRTTQPFGVLHGGASCVLAETLGSIGGAFCVDFKKQFVVGLEINANHIRGAKEGYVYGTAKPLHLGETTQVWEIKITAESNQLVCISRLTLAVIDIK